MLTDVGLLVLMPELQWIKYVLPRFPKMAQMGRIKEQLKASLHQPTLGLLCPTSLGSELMLKGAGA